MKENIHRVLLTLCTAAAVLGASPIPWRAYQGPDVGGRAPALSGSVAAMGDDASLAFWNPAALAFMPWQMATAGYVHQAGVLADPLFSGPKRLNYMAVAGPNGAFAWRSLARYRQETAQAAGPDTAFQYLKYSVDEISLAFAVCDPAYPDVALGLSAKLLWSRLTQQDQAWTGPGYTRAVLLDENGVGYGLDAGLLWKAGRVRLFANVQNALAKVYFDEVADDRPKARASGGIGWSDEGLPSFSVGAEKYLFRGSPWLRWMAAGEYKRTIENYGGLSLRAGYAAYHKGPSDGASWSWGVGYVYRRLLVDAAAVNLRDTVSGRWRPTYTASLGIHLN
ncbi:MAG: hypothetical protein MUF78_01170 [Candidatus Edwardsbacteria bacterium]|jgi:hypothetical protein|nr:hypothetical protein [Candidatus Edwardsbacteria bacterium]